MSKTARITCKYSMTQRYIFYIRTLRHNGPLLYMHIRFVRIICAKMEFEFAGPKGQAQHCRFSCLPQPETGVITVALLLLLRPLLVAVGGAAAWFMALPHSAVPNFP